MSNKSRGSQSNIPAQVRVVLERRSQDHSFPGAYQLRDPDFPQQIPTQIDLVKINIMPDTLKKKVIKSSQDGTIKIRENGLQRG